MLQYLAPINIFIFESVSYSFKYGNSVYSKNKVLTRASGLLDIEPVFLLVSKSNFSIESIQFRFRRTAIKFVH